MKAAAGVLVQTFEAPPAGGTGTRSARLYDTLRQAIGEGRLVAGDRLPSARLLASEWKLSRGAVDEAFARLQDEGLLVRRVGDGSYVAHRPPARKAPADRSPPGDATPAALRVQAPFAPWLRDTRHLEMARRPEAPLPLHPRHWPAEQFPLAVWRRLQHAALAEGDRARLGYGPAAGLPALRSAIARHLGQTRSLRCRPEQVIVVNSPLQGIETVVRVLLQPGDRVWVEDPGHPSLPLLMAMLHLNPVGVPLDAQGLDVAHGLARAPDARLAYLHPLAQYPLGIRTTAARGAELLHWARQRGAWVLEGCFNDELTYRPGVPPALASHDRSGCVVLMHTFEGVMFPSLRVACLVVPERLVEAFEAARGLLGDHTSMPTQQALAAFFDDGHFTRHLRRLRQACAQRREAWLHGVQRHLAGLAVAGPVEAGLHACLHLPASHVDAEVMARLRARGIGSEPLSTRCWQASGRNGLVFAYGAATPAQIDAALRVVAEELSRP